MATNSCLEEQTYLDIPGVLIKTLKKRAIMEFKFNMSYLDFEYDTTKSTIQEEFDENGVSNSAFLYLQITSIVSFSITFILGTLGNGLVIWIAGFKMKRNVNTVWILNLGIADFVFNIFFPFQITEWAMRGHWPFGEIMCKAIFFLLYLNMFSSISFLLLISVDRCTSVLYPVWSKNHRTPRLAAIVSVITWMLCFALSCPYLPYYEVVHDPYTNLEHCVPMFEDGDGITNWKRNSMLITQFLSMFLIPFSIILVCYTLIMIRIGRRKSLSGSNRPFKIIISIILCFFICWFPFHFWPLIQIMDIGLSTNLDFIMFHIFCCLAFFNSCLNPILYVFIGREFKTNFIKSIPFILENTFKRMDTDGEELCDQSGTTGTEASTSYV
ncbi:formyl peptide receptor 2-like [Pelobates fuscus]|uniref:formyl peptide receptor 2-like n=1 Tax=Pelobates fuscus TaxID=191477 RepID=UPI002FE43275